MSGEINGPPSSWYDPPNVYELDVMDLPDTGDICEFCDKNHIVVKVAEEFFWGWGEFEKMCSSCLAHEYKIDVARSKFDEEPT